MNPVAPRYCNSLMKKILFICLQVSTTTDGLDADLWKDGLFKSKVTRYLCFTRVFSKENVSEVASLTSYARNSVVILLL